MSSMVANVGVVVGIVSPAHCVQQLFPLPVSIGVILNLGVAERRTMSGNVGSAMSKSVVRGRKHGDSI